MKHQYYERLFIFLLQSTPPLEVFKQSLSKLISYPLTDLVIERLPSPDLYEFLSALSASPYDLSRLKLRPLLYDHALSPQSFLLLRRMCLRVSELSLSGGTPPISSLLNYVLFKELNSDYTLNGFAEALQNAIQELQNTKDSRASHTARDPKKFRQSFSQHHQASSHASQIVKNVLIKSCAGATADGSLVSLLRHAKARQILAEYGISVYLLISLLDRKGRVDSSAHEVEELLLCLPEQIYNLSDDKRVLMDLCIRNRHDGQCSACGVLVRPEHKPSELFFTGIINAFETAVMEEDVLAIHKILLHHSGAVEGTSHESLLGHRTLKILLRMISQSFSAKTCAAEVTLINHSCESQAILNRCEGQAILNRCESQDQNRDYRLLINLVGCFALTDETIAILISFLKSNDDLRVIELINVIMKEKRLYFAAFATLLKIFMNSQRTEGHYVTLVLQNTLSRFSFEFESIIEMILEYYVCINDQKVSSFCVHKQTDSYRLISDQNDVIVLSQIFEDLATLFSMDRTAFVARHLFYILKVPRIHPLLSAAFMQQNRRHLLIWSILAGKYTGYVESVDVLVGLLSNGHFQLDAHFKPFPKEFIRANISQILFKLKDAYRTGCYGMRCCIYKILRYLIEGLRISLYFNYVWPVLEYVLTHNTNHICRRGVRRQDGGLHKHNDDVETDQCASGFMSWISAQYTSPLMIPFLEVPFKDINDFRVVPGVERELVPVLKRYFAYLARRMGRTEALPANHPGMSHSRLLSEYRVMLNFICFYKQNSAFRQRITEVYAGCPAEAVALLGHLPLDSRLRRQAPSAGQLQQQSSDLIRNDVATTSFDITEFMLVNYLVKISNAKQDVHFFVIQEFMKHLRSTLPEDVEKIVEQFRHTRYECVKTGSAVLNSPVNALCSGRPTYHGFMVLLFKELLDSLSGYEHLRHVLLLSSDVLEGALLGLIRLLDGQDPTGFAPRLLDRINTIRVSNRSEYYDMVAAPLEEDRRVSVFMLKINSFVGRQIVSTDLMVYNAMVADDFHAIIFALDDSSTASQCDLSLLQLAYYLISDYERANRLDGGYAAVRLFLNLCLEPDFKAAEEYIPTIERIIKRDGSVIDHDDVTTHCNDVAAHCNDVAAHFDDVTAYYNDVTAYYNDVTLYATNSIKIKYIVNKMKYIVDTNTNMDRARYLEQQELFDLINRTATLNDTAGIQAIRRRLSDLSAGESTALNRLELHALKDLEFMRSAPLLADCSCDVLRVIELRRSISHDRDALLAIHREMAASLQHKQFMRNVEIEYIHKHLSGKNYSACGRLISKMLLSGDWEVLYEQALVKADQKRAHEAREILQRLLQKYRDNGITNSCRFIRASVKFAELSNSESVYNEVIKCVCSDDAHNRNNGINNGIVNTASDSSNMTPDTHTQTSFNDINKLYFLAAKFFERSNKMLALRFYHKTFRSNYESIPRFFHLANSIDRKDLKKLEGFGSQIIAEDLPLLLPFYSQISNKLSLTGPAKEFYWKVSRELLERFPYATVWNTLELINSRKGETRQRVVEMISGLSLENRVIVKNIQKIAEQFILISKSKKKDLSMQDFQLAELLPAAVNVPGKSTMISGVKDEIYTFVSLQAPKRIVLRGEDGLEYPLIVKYNDDLRKDSRVVELCGLISQMLGQDGSRMNIRRYGVIPLTHEAGIIEYISGLVPLKSLCLEYYKQANEVAARFVRQRRIGGQNMAGVLEVFKPVLHRHMKQCALDPFDFYARRDNYVTTYAVMCVVGWFIGLGDRHAENVQFDGGTWETVHVDLNCIFEKGKTFQVPETVPFRLTQNVVDGFGILGVEGTFKRVFKHVLTVMQENRGGILANMLSFVHDPLFEWGSKKNESERIMGVLEKKLMFDDVHVKTDELVGEAMDIGNLGNMYIGWMAFM